MLKTEFSGQFKKDYKLAVKRGLDIKKLEQVVIRIYFNSFFVPFFFLFPVFTTGFFVLLCH